MEIHSASSEKHQVRRGRRPRDSEGKASTPVKARILIVDDEFFVAWHLQSLLEDMGLPDCEIASDADTATRVAADFEANLLLMDVNLGEGPDGLATARRILEQRDVEVIFITAYTDELNVRRIRDVNPYAPILTKPVSVELLRAAIKRVFPTD